MAIDTIGTNAIANDRVTEQNSSGAVDPGITAIPDGSVTTAKLTMIKRCSKDWYW